MWPASRIIEIQILSISCLLIGFSPSIYSQQSTQSLLTSDDRQPQALAWFKDTATAFQELSSAPVECLSNSNSDRIKLGRIAFNSPRLLGGQSARMGLNCASCHPAGRRSEGFFIKQISLEAGTADVTHSLLSSNGGNQRFNPTRIPDLANPKDLKIIDRDSEAFRQQLVRLIELEFDGQPAPLDVFDAVRVYLKNTHLDHCVAPSGRTPRDLASDWRLIADSLALIDKATQNTGEQTFSVHTRDFLIGAARAQLETIYRRYATTESEQVDKQLITFSRRLEKLKDVLGHDKHSNKHIRELQQDAVRLHTLLRSKEQTSTYNPTVLARLLGLQVSE